MHRSTRAQARGSSASPPGIWLPIMNLRGLDNLSLACLRIESTGLRHKGIFQAQEPLLKKSSRKVGGSKRSTTRQRKSKEHQREMTIGRNQLRQIVSANSVVDAERKKVVEIQTVTEISQETKHGQVDVASRVARASQQEEQQGTHKESIDCGELQSRTQQPIPREESEWLSGQQ